ncbi:MAG: UDP-3-O-(3-hydroxymyristoyl)glucosamine N-acyltransferase, partial [Planctomycetes bacterium]|nr:UDP-3-O-(3-hydroxymyristoyl)glucosamine N-acyltransferase [Planctomycetota bacterium]
REGDLTFVANPKYNPMLASTRASAVIVPAGTEAAGKNLVVSRNSYLSFAKAVDLFHPPAPEPSASVNPRANVDPSAVLGRNVSIHAGATVGRSAILGDRVVIHPGAYVGDGARVGRETVIHANAVLYPGTEVGERVILHAGVVLGSDGFGFAREGPKSVKIRQVGKVVVEDDVEIGANCAVDRAVLGETRIGRGTKMDNLIQVGHNVRIGENCLIVAQVGISGSTVVGNNVSLGGQVGVKGHVRIGDGAEIGGQSGVVDDIAPGLKVLGTPAIPLPQARKVLLMTPFIPEMRRELRELRQKVAELERRLSERPT